MDSFVNGRTARPPQAGQRKAASGYTVAFQHASMISARSCSRERGRKEPPNFALMAALSRGVALFSACTLRPAPERAAVDGLAPEASAAGVQFLASAQARHGSCTLLNHSKHPIGYWGYAQDTPRLATYVYDLDAPTVLHKIWSNGVQPSV